MDERDIVERLRIWADGCSDSTQQQIPARLMKLAAAEIERLRHDLTRARETQGELLEELNVQGLRAIDAEDNLAEARKVIEPFAEAGSLVPPDRKDFQIVASVPGGHNAEAFRKMGLFLTAGNLRRASTFLALTGADRP